MQIVIDMPKEEYEIIKACKAPMTWVEHLIKNGTPLDEHDEEVIAETVESIWGKPPYIEVLDKIRAEIEKAVWEDVVISLNGTEEVRIPRLDPDDVFEIIDKYKAESED